MTSYNIRHISSVDGRGVVGLSEGVAHKITCAVKDCEDGT